MSAASVVRRPTTAEQVEARLGHAEDVYARLPGGPGTGAVSALASMVDRGVARAAAPSPADITLADEAMGWYRWLDPQAAWIVRQRARGLTWVSIAELAKDRRLRLRRPKHGRVQIVKDESGVVRAESRGADREHVRVVLAESTIRHRHKQAIGTILLRLIEK